MGLGECAYCAWGWDSQLSLKSGLGLSLPPGTKGRGVAGASYGSDSNECFTWLLAKGLGTMEQVRVQQCCQQCWLHVFVLSLSAACLSQPGCCCVHMRISSTGAGHQMLFVIPGPGVWLVLLRGRILRFRGDVCMWLCFHSSFSGTTMPRWSGKGAVVVQHSAISTIQVH
jgi:hypothetical protein